MPKSKLQLYNRVLEVLQVKASGNPASAEDIDLVEAALQPLLAELNEIDIVFVGVDPTDRTSADIEDKVFHPLADVLADEVATSFGSPRSNDRQTLLNRLRRVVQAEPGYFPQEAMYF